MIIPYVIDKQNYKLADICHAILANHTGHSMDARDNRIFQYPGQQATQKRTFSVEQFQASALGRIFFRHQDRTQVIQES